MKRRSSAVKAALLGGGLAIAVPLSADAQVGALGAAAALGALGENAHAGVPVLTESARVLPQGGWSGSAIAGFTSGTAGVGTPSEQGFNAFQLFLSGFVSPAEDLTVGAILSTVNRVSFDSFEGESGLGDLTLYGKYRFGGDDQTDIAAIGTLGLPTGADGFGSEGLVIGAGAAVSRQLDGGSIHASGVVGIPTDDSDGDTFVNLTAAGVLGLTDRVGISAEGSLVFASDTFFAAGPAVRFRAGDSVFLDGGLIFELIAPDGFADSDVAFVFGVNIGG